MTIGSMISGVSVKRTAMMDPALMNTREVFQWPSES
jgi:hypothetical protein